MHDVNSANAWAISEPSSSQSQLQVREVTLDRDFDELHNEWNSLVERLDGPTPFDTWEWNRVWWKHFGAQHRLRILVFLSDQQVVGLSQLYEWRHLGLTWLVPLGWEDFQGRYGITEQIQFLFPPQERDRILSAMWTWLEMNPWSLLLMPIRNDETLPSRFSGRVVRRQMFEFYGRPLPETWADFVAGLNRSMKDNVKYYPRLMLRHHHQFRLEVADTPEAIAEFLPHLIELHRQRARIGTHRKNYFDHPGHVACVSDAARLLATSGQAKIGILKVGDETVAAQMWFERGNKIFFYYTGWAINWAKYSVALVTTLEILRDAILRRISGVEFLRGRALFKERWDVEERLDGYVVLARRPRVARALVLMPTQWRMLMHRVGARIERLLRG